MRLLIYTLAVLILILSSCSRTSAEMNEKSVSDNTFTVNDNVVDYDSTKADDDYSDESANVSFRINDYDDKPSGDGHFIGVFYDNNFYSWLAQITNENEINSYIQQGEYIGESKEKQSVYEGASDEVIDGADDWSPDSDLECNGLDAGTPLYRLNDYIFAVYNTPVETDRLTVHEPDGTKHDIVFYIYGNLYRKSE